MSPVHYFSCECNKILKSRSDDILLNGIILRAQLKNQIVDNDGDCSVSTRRRRATWITPSKHSATRGYARTPRTT